ncbi:MAG TPA: helix-turn-helix transcriptional regulator [Trichocoleus sp.]|jgi:DNA-binding Xre family transcriptional regulator
MAEVLEKVPSVARISWKLRQVLADRKITNQALSEVTGSHPTTISRLKSKDTIPAIGNDEIEKIRRAIEEISGRPCLMAELVQVDEGVD